MKCKQCGGEVGSEQERCPYCNAINKEAVRRKRQIHRKRIFNKDLRRRVLEESREDIWNRILNRAIAVMVCIFAAACMLGFTVNMAAGGMGKLFNKPDNMEEQLERLYENREFAQMSYLLDEYGLMGTDYYRYSQMALLNSTYERFINNRNECISQIEENKDLMELDLENVLRYGCNVLAPDIPYYREMDSENKIILEEYQQSVKAFYQSYLKLKDKEIDELAEAVQLGSSASRHLEESMEVIRERLGK